MNPADIPKADDWHELLTFDVTAVPVLSGKNFLRRMNIEARATTAAKIKAEYDMCDKTNTEGVASLAEKHLEAFAVSGRAYVSFLLNGIKNHLSFTSELIKGLSCFDPAVMFVLPTTFAATRFVFLYRSFSRRKWVPVADEQPCRDEYLSFIDGLRVTYPDYIKTPELVRDVIDLLAPLASLKERPMLRYLFQLSCLCMTSTRTEFPTVRFGDFTSESASCKFTESVFPVQSYLPAVPGSIDVCVTPDSIARFLSLEESPSEISSTYDPWSSVDLSGRVGIYRALYQRFLACQRPRKPSPTKVKAVNVIPAPPTAPKSLQPPVKVAGKVNYGKISAAEIDSTVAELRQCGSKD